MPFTVCHFVPHYLHILSFNPLKNLKRLVNATPILEVGILIPERVSHWLKVTEEE